MFLNWNSRFSQKKKREPPNTGMELVELEQGWEGNFIHWMNVVDNVLNRMGFPLHVMEKVVYKEQQLETVKRRGIGNCRNSDEGG